METEFVSGLPIWKKMSGCRAQENGSLVNGNAMEGMGNVAAGIARSTTHSGASFAMLNISGSKQMAKMAAKMMSERKMNTSTN